MNSKIYNQAWVILVPLLIFCGVISTCNAATGEGMALSGEVLGGQQEDVDVTSIYGTFTTPVQYPLALHLEAVSDDASGDSLQGIGAHVYFRDPDWGLLGFTAMDVSVDLMETDELPAIENLDINTYGLEAEAHFASLVLALQGGRIESDELEFEKDQYTNVELHWFAGKKWHLVAGSHRFAGETTNLVETDYTHFINSHYISAYLGGTWDAFDNVYLGVEFGSASKTGANWVFFAEVDSGEAGYDAVFVGLRFEFGPLDAAPILSLFERNTGGYSFISTQSSSSTIGNGTGMHN
ncbi:MAG: hypothetical protein AMJ55_12100 [Gammaproteobacteria bacterium SG8_15]|nr:MAG: hypothetical protein AMJ55_12100 [Gammaproteobacteria bacterium SG8_15]